MPLRLVDSGGGLRVIGAAILLLALLATPVGAQEAPASSDHPIPVIASGDATAQAPFDQQFIDMMVPHHEGAVAMARIALQRASRSEIRQMADDIVRSQSAEIDQMRAWRQAWYGSGETPSMDQMPMLHAMAGMGDMSAPMPATMNMAEEVERLRTAPEPFELAFIDLMIPHHQSAIDAARLALQQAEREEIRALAREIIAAQQREIDQMRAWRQAWFGQQSPAATPVAPANPPAPMPPGHTRH